MFVQPPVVGCLTLHAMVKVEGPRNNEQNLQGYGMSFHSVL